MQSETPLDFNGEHLVKSVQVWILFLLAVLSRNVVNEFFDSQILVRLANSEYPS